MCSFTRVKIIFYPLLPHHPIWTLTHMHMRTHTQSCVSWYMVIIEAIVNICWTVVVLVRQGHSTCDTSTHEVTKRILFYSSGPASEHTEPRCLWLKTSVPQLFCHLSPFYSWSSALSINRESPKDLCKHF